MRRDSPLRSTSFRLAITVAALLFTAFLLSGGVAYRYVKSELLHWRDRQIMEMFRVLSETYNADKPEEFIDAVNAHVAATQSHDSVFLLQGPNGGVLASNVRQIRSNSGWSELPGAELGIDVDFPYRLYEGKVGDYRLVVGLSGGVIDELEEIMLASLFWSSIVVIALAVGGGAALGMRAQQRVNAVRETMESVAQGKLDARIPLIGNGDDIDRLSEDVNGALERLSTMVEGMRQVSADIAHDLRTPLNRLKILIDTASKKYERGVPVADELTAAFAECNRINEIFGALLRIAQIESGARRERFTNIDISAIFENVAQIYHDVAEDAGQTFLYTSVVSAPTTVHGDRELLTQLFVNLIENAIRHCPKGAKIECSLRVLSGSIVAAVADNGPGIPPNERENVLRRLYRLEKSRTTPGSGLGLSTAKAITDLHGARLTLEDNGPGLRISVEFPISQRTQS